MGGTVLSLSIGWIYVMKINQIIWKMLMNQTKFGKRKDNLKYNLSFSSNDLV